VSAADDALGRTEELLARLEATRAELERLAADEDVDKALEVLGRLSELAKEVEQELERAKRASEADAQS
jgi:hypothetical protein